MFKNNHCKLCKNNNTTSYSYKQGGNISSQSYGNNITELPSKTQKLYNSIKDKTITEMTVVRAPIYSIIKKVLDVVSLGAFSKVSKKLGYDDIYHLSLRVKTEDGGDYRIEKNQNILISNYRKEKDEQSINVPLNDREITIGGLFERASKGYGINKFYKYEAFSTNCQEFILNLLKWSGFLTSDLRKFILQDTEELLKTLPSGVKEGVDVITDVASALDKIRQLLPFKQGGKIPDYEYEDI